MSNEAGADLDVRVDPAEMLQYVYALMTAPRTGRSRLAPERWGGDSPVARAARLRWDALNRAFADERVGSWTGRLRPNQIHVPAALIAAAGVARLTMSGDEAVFDIPALLDATLELCEPAGNA